MHEGTENAPTDLFANQISRALQSVHRGCEVLLRRDLVYRMSEFAPWQWLDLPRGIIVPSERVRLGFWHRNLQRQQWKANNETKQQKAGVLNVLTARSPK